MASIGPKSKNEFKTDWQNQQHQGTQDRDCDSESGRGNLNFKLNFIEFSDSELDYRLPAARRPPPPAAAAAAATVGGPPPEQAARPGLSESLLAGVRRTGMLPGPPAGPGTRTSQY
jgi:hypothetical protein